MFERDSRASRVLRRTGKTFLVGGVLAVGAGIGECREASKETQSLSPSIATVSGSPEVKVTIQISESPQQYPLNKEIQILLVAGFGLISIGAGIMRHDELLQDEADRLAEEVQPS